MLDEFNALEGKIVQVISLCRALRAENDLLRQRLATAEAEKHGLAERVEMARYRVEQLVRQLPDAETPA
jgi:cell division protein ZapB